MTGLIDRYIAVWNEPDAAKRDAAVAEIEPVEGLARRIRRSARVVLRPSARG